MIRRAVALVALLGPAISLADPPVTPIAPEEDANARVQRLLQRESPPLSRKRFTVAGGSISAEVEAQEITVDQEQGLDRVTISLGADAPVVCVLLKGDVDGPTGIWRAAHRLAEAGHRILKSRPGEVVVAGDAPVVFAEYIYAAKQGDGYAPGHLKQAVWIQPNRPVACYLEALGYSETFQRVVKGLVDSLAATVPVDTSVQYAEIQLVKVDGYAVGYGMLEIVRGGAEGERWVRRRSGLFSPEQPEMGAREDRATLRVDASGTIVDGRASGIRNAGSAYDVRIARTGQGYEIDGTVAGTAVKASIAAKDGLASELLVSRRLARLAEQRTGEVRIAEWQPDENPTAAVDTRFRRESGSRYVCMTPPGGADAGCGVVDRAGRLESLSSRGRRPEIATQRVWSRGAL